MSDINVDEGQVPFDGNADQDLMVRDLQAPFIDDDIGRPCSNPVRSQSPTCVRSHDTLGCSKFYRFNGFYCALRVLRILSNFFLSCYLAPSRRWHFPHGHPLPAARLRELNADIIAGPYLLTDFVDHASHNNAQIVRLSLTSADLIKCRSRLFALHFHLVRNPEDEHVSRLGQIVSKPCSSH